MNAHGMAQYSPPSFGTKMDGKARSALPSFGTGPPTPPTSTSNMLLFSKYDTTSSTTTAHPQECLSPETQDSSHRNPTHPESKVKEQHDDDELTTDRMNQLIEKKRKRRESHNIVERRRRDTINARIDELSSLLPPPPPPHSQSSSSSHPHKLNRGVILKNSVDHIRMLQHHVMEQQQRIHELETLMEKYRPTGDQPPLRLPAYHPQQQQQQQMQTPYTGPTYTGSL